jgi:hypothetical protein
MSEPRLPPLTEIHRWEAFAGHLNRILDTQAPIRDATFAFDLRYGHDDQRAAQWLARLQVLVFTDLATLLRQAMRPFINVNREVYSYLEDEPEDKDTLAELDASKGTSPGRPKETKLPHLTDIAELSGFSYHACGILDALDDAREVSLAFVATCGVDDEAATTALAGIQVQLFFHLRYHIGKRGLYEIG